MRLQAARNGNASRRSITGSIMHTCNDCKVGLVRQEMQLVCPKCGLVEEFFEGVE